MNKTSIIVISLVSTLMFSCSFNSKKLKETQGLISERTKELNSAAKISGEKTKIDLIKTESALSQTNFFDAKLTLGAAQNSHDLTLDFLNRNEGLLGKPLEDQKNSVESLLSTNSNIYKAEVRVQNDKIKEEENWKKIEEERKNNLIQMGQKYEEQQNKNLVKKVWVWSISTLGIGGLVAIIVIFPAAVPLIGQLIGWLISLIPQLASFFQLVSKSAFKSVAIGVSKVREELKRNPEETVKKKDVLALINNELKAATDQSHRNVIDQIRKEYNL